MPRYKQVKNLKKSCLQNIAKNMDTVWVPMAKGEPSRGSVAYYGNTGPFTHLTGELVSEIMKTVREMGQMKRHYLMLFLLPQLQQLDLSLYETSDSILYMVGERCQHLKKLYLCWNVVVGAEILKDIVSKMPMLTHINVAGTKCDDVVVSTISMYCEKLQDLDVSDCNVTSKGIQQLCGGYNETIKRLPHLVRLNLQGTKVDVKGIQMILRKMKGIRYLEHEWLWNILNDMYMPHDTEAPVKNTEKLAIQKINFFGCPYTAMVIKAVDVLCAFCPSLTEVSIFGCGFDDQAMFKLSRLPNLRTFCLEDSHNMVSFRWGLLPFLHERGSSLIEMSLTSVDDLNIVEVSTYCTNLKVLSLIDVSTTTVHNVQSHAYLQSLEQLEIRQHLHDKFGEDTFKFIMKNCHNIRQILLFSLDFITDEVLLDIMKENPFPALHKITIERSAGYSIYVIIKFMNHCPSLKMLHVADIEVGTDLQQYVKLHNYDIVV